MSVFAVFGINVLAVFVSAIVAAWLYLWPSLRTIERKRALALLVAPHMFLRFIGLSFLVPGVVSPTLPAAFAIPAAWGDFGAGILAIVATVALLRRTSWAVAATWLFNLWGTADFLLAFYQGRHAQLQPGALGASYFIVTTLVPILLVTHGLLFRLLAGPRGQLEGRADRG